MRYRFPYVGADLRKPLLQPGISEHCETTDTGWCRPITRYVYTREWNKFEETFTCFDTIYECDGQTDGQKPYDGKNDTSDRRYCDFCFHFHFRRVQWTDALGLEACEPGVPGLQTDLIRRVEGQQMDARSSDHPSLLRSLTSGLKRIPTLNFIGLAVALHLSFFFVFAKFELNIAVLKAVFSLF